MYSQALSSSFGFLISEYQILSGPGAVSFLLLLKASLNSSLLSSLLGPLCASVLLRSLSTRFLSFKWFWLLCCTSCPRKAWPFSSLVLPCWCLLSLMLFWYEHSLPFSTIDRTVSALSSSQMLSHLAFFASGAFSLNCSVLVFTACSFECVWVWSSFSFLPVFHCGMFFCPSFLGLTVLPWWLLHAFLWACYALCWFLLVQFWQCLNLTFHTWRDLAWCFAY